MVTTSHPKSPVGPRRARAPRVLIAEDDPDMRSLAADVVEQLGAEVWSVGSGHALADELERRRRSPDLVIDLLITDHRMPGPEGAAVVEEMRRYNASLPVLVISAFADKELTSKVRSLPAVELLEKPFDLEVFRDRVQRLLEGP